MYNMKLNYGGVMEQENKPRANLCKLSNCSSWRALFIYYSGIIVDKVAQKAIYNFNPYIDRVMISLNSHLNPRINIVQLYAPTADKDTIETFYEQIGNVLNLTKTHDTNIAMGDINSKVGRG